ncbi:universal stress protein [Streptomyces gamaensis]|uniref:Universal stress protein n=1 Tax=Streptomyces gamaensis TaxID=1763542 RepID=A0ABW0YZK6_9ACTN
MVRPVAVGVDGSAESLVAAAWAGREAVLRALPLRIVHALEQRGGGPHFAAEVPDGRDWAESRIEAAAEEILEAHPRLRITVDRIAEPPAQALGEAAREAELLAVGSRGLAPLQGFLLGPVSLAVLAYALRPVVVVHEPESLPGPGDVSPVTVGLGHHEAYGQLLAFAFEAAAVRGTMLRVVQTDEPEPSGERPPHDADALARSLAPWRRRWPTVEIEEWLSSGSPAQRLVAAADDAQLLVVGRREHRPVPSALIGAVTHGVLHHARCPVAVVPHG